MLSINVRRDGTTTTMSARTAPSATKPRRSTLLHQGRLVCPDAKRVGLSYNDRTRLKTRLACLPESRVNFWELKLTTNAACDGIAIDKLEKFG